MRGPDTKAGRLSVVVALALALAVTGVWIRGVGLTEYFGFAICVGGSSIALGTLLAVPFVSRVLRRVAAPSGSARLGLGAVILGTLSLASFAAAFASTFTLRPSMQEVDAAIAKGDTELALHVLSALYELEGNSERVKAGERRALLSAASRAGGEERLALLDKVDDRGARLEMVRSSIAAGRANDAFVAIERWFAGSKDADVREELARAHELALKACAEDACSLTHASAATAAAETSARTAAATEIRTRLLDALAIPAAAEPDLVARLRNVRELSVLATKTLSASTKFPEVQGKAKELLEWANAQVAKVPLLGARLEVAAQILPTAFKMNEKTALAHLDGGVDVYLNLDGRGAIRGVYAIATEEAKRVFSSSSWTPNRILSQATGRSTAMVASSKDPVLRWNEGNVPVVARYRDNNLVELRIGDARP